MLTKIPSGKDAARESTADFPRSVDAWFLFVFADGRIAISAPGGEALRTLPNPYPNPAMAERLAGFRAEMAMKEFREMIGEIRRGDG